MHNSATFVLQLILLKAMPCLPCLKIGKALPWGSVLTPESCLSKIEVRAQSKKIQVEALHSSS